MAGITTNYSQPSGNCINAVDKLKGTMLEGIGKSSEGSGLHGGEMEAHMRRYNPEKYEKTVMDMLKTQYENYATNDSDDKGFRQYVSKEADYLFDNIEKYWGVLLSR